MSSLINLVRHQMVSVLLVLTIVVILTAASWVGWRLTKSYESFIADFQRQQAVELVGVATDELLWNRYEAFGIELAQSVARNKELAKAMKSGDAEAVAAIFTDEFHQGLVSEGRVSLLGFSAYDTKGALKGEAWLDEAANKAMPADMLARVTGREGAERLESMSIARTTDRGPILTIFAPVGGLRLTGYVAAHIDLIYGLKTLDTRLGMSVELNQLNDGPTLKVLDHVSFDTDAITNEFHVPISMRTGEPLLDLKLKTNVTELATKLADKRVEFFLLFLSVAGTAGVVGIAIVSIALFRGKRREAVMNAAVEAARQAEEEERTANAARQAKLEEEKAEELRRSVLDLCDHLENDLESVVSMVSSQTTAMRGDAGTLSQTVQRISTMMASVSSSAQEANGNIQTVAAATEELASSSKEIGARVMESASIASQAVSSAEATDGTVRTLAEAAQKIGEVTTLIQDIAEQTNLLALNATIEAARAGEAGRGFAVVASEVKSLANQTAQATDEIGNQIKAIQTAADDTVGAIGGITDEIGNINQIVTAIASAVEEQAAATQEIARNSQEASSGIQSVTESAVGTSDETQSVAGIATQLEGTTTAVGDQIEEMLVRIKGALSEVRRQNGAGGAERVA